MKLTFLVAAALLVISDSSTEALPISSKQTRSFSLPLKRLHGAREGLHPQVLLQQHINRSQRRHALMTGQDAPSDDQLAKNLQKRVDSLPLGLAKRYNVHGAPVDMTKGVTKATLSASALSLHEGHGDDDTDNKGNGSAAVSNTTTTDNSEGFTQAEIDALINPDLTTEANEPQDSGNSLGLDIIRNDIGYAADIKIGTPPREFLILMDSGSADFWVGGENCVSEEGGGCGNHLFLGNQTSSTFVDSGEPWDITYGSGAAAGTIIQDTLNFGDFTLTNHTFGIALLESVEFTSQGTPFDGLMGTALSTLANQGTLTPVEALREQGLVDEAIVSYKMARIADGGENDGVITFGALDESKFDPNTLVTVDNLSRVGFWEAAVDSVSVDGTELDLAGRTAILDTGTTLMLIPQEDADAIHAAIDGARPDGQGGFIIPCTTEASIALTFGGASFTIDPRDLVFFPVDFDDLTGDCVSGISGGSFGGSNQWLVGDVFLKSAYFSTNADTNELSLAQLV